MSDTQTNINVVTHEVRVDAPIEDIWEAISTEEGRDRWLEPGADRRLVVEENEPPYRITWWWWQESDLDQPARHVEVRIAASPDGGTRVIVTETQPALVPLTMLAASLASVCA